MRILLGVCSCITTLVRTIFVVYVALSMFRLIVIVNAMRNRAVRTPYLLFSNLTRLKIKLFAKVVFFLQNEETLCECKHACIVFCSATMKSRSTFAGLYMLIIAYPILPYEHVSGYKYRRQLSQNSLYIRENSVSFTK